MSCRGGRGPARLNAVLRPAVGGALGVQKIGASIGHIGSQSTSQLPGQIGTVDAVDVLVGARLDSTSSWTGTLDAGREGWMSE